jgi:hypothetical protein
MGFRYQKYGNYGQPSHFGGQYCAFFAESQLYLQPKQFTIVTADRRGVLITSDQTTCSFPDKSSAKKKGLLAYMLGFEDTTHL